MVYGQDEKQMSEGEGRAGQRRVKALLKLLLQLQTSSDKTRSPSGMELLFSYSNEYIPPKQQTSTLMKYKFTHKNKYIFNR